jgi:hypothetical protein
MNYDALIVTSFLFSKIMEKHFFLKITIFCYCCKHIDQAVFLRRVEVLQILGIEVFRGFIYQLHEIFNN